MTRVTINTTVLSAPTDYRVLVKEELLNTVVVDTVVVNT